MKELSKKESEFWVVWDPQGGAGPCKFVVLGSAIEFAKRNARLAPGAPIYVLHSSYKVVVGEEVISSIVGHHFEVDDEIPF